MLKLRLIRHPKPQVDMGICYGATDLPAEEAAFSSTLHHCLLMPRPHVLISSPLQRCRRLAEALGERGWPAPLVHEDLAEMNFGEWEMRPWKAIERAQIDAWTGDIGRFAPPGGESVQQVAERARRSLAALLASHADDQGLRERLPPQGEGVAVICHSGVIQGLHHELQGKPWERFKPFKIDYGEALELHAPWTALHHG